MEDDQHAVLVRAVRKTYHSDEVPVRALRGADLALRRGEFVALMGPSASGNESCGLPPHLPPGTAAGSLAIV
jgi:predicted ABC-type transport system involved in lysophospholipase L1 biosynthesis ATPase subunit